MFKPKNFSVSELQYGLIDCFGKFYSYKNAIKNTIHTSLISIKVGAQNLYTRKRFPSFHPSLMRFVGKGILTSWIRNNKTYLRYVEQYKKFMEV